MCSIVIDVPERVMNALKMGPDAVGLEMRMVAAVKLYELGRLSSGAAAGLAGVPKVVFLMKLVDYGVDTFRFTREDLLREPSLL